MSEDAYTWKRAGKGLDDVAVFDVAFAGDRVVLGTEVGVWCGDGIGGWQKEGLHGLVRGVDVCGEMWVAGCMPGGVWVREKVGKGWTYLPDLPGHVNVVLSVGGGA